MADGTDARYMARALQLAAALAQAQHDKESSSAALQALQRKELSVAADHADALALHTEHTLAASEAKAQELDAALKDFVRTEVLALLATEDEEARDAALALSEQLSDALCRFGSSLNSQGEPIGGLTRPTHVLDCSSVRSGRPAVGRVRPLHAYSQQNSRHFDLSLVWCPASCTR